MNNGRLPTSSSHPPSVSFFIADDLGDRQLVELLPIQWRRPQISVVGTKTNIPITVTVLGNRWE